MVLSLCYHWLCSFIKIIIEIMRLFVALFPDEQVRGHLRDIKRQLSKFKRNFKFTPLDQIHLTLKFLGDNVDIETYEMYTESLAKRLSEIKQFTYSLERVRFGFPGQIMPKVVFSKVNDSFEISNLSDISTEVAKQFNSHEIITKKEQKKLLHHFTIARVKTGISKAFGRNFNDILQNIEYPTIESLASEVIIIESVVTSAGPVYKPLSKIPLKI